MKLTAFWCSCLLACTISVTDLFGYYSFNVTRQIPVFDKYVCDNILFAGTMKANPSKLSELINNLNRINYDEHFPYTVLNSSTDIYLKNTKQDATLINNRFKKGSAKKKLQKSFLTPGFIDWSIIKIKPDSSKTKDKVINIQSILDTESNKGFFWILPGFLIGLIIGILGLYYYSRKMIYTILKNEKKNYLNKLKNDFELPLYQKRSFKYIGLVAVLKQSKDKKKKKLKEYKNNKAKQAEEITLIQLNKHDIKTSEDRNIDSKTEDDHINNNFKSKEEIIDKKAVRELYFFMPNNDGSFTNSNAMVYQTIECLYKILVDESGQRGELHYISGEYDMRALDNIEYYLNPVCEIDNIASRLSAKEIQMINPGVVINLEDVWRIEDNKKVRIRFK